MACERTLKDAGYDLVFSSFRYTEGDRPGQIKLPRFLAQDGLVDGAILAGVQHSNLLRVFQRLKLPYVLLGTNFVGKGSDIEHNTVTYDDVAGIFEAASYLIRLGHRRLSFVGNVEKPWFRRRYEGYSRALGEANLALNSVVEPWQVSNTEYGELATEALLRQNRPPTAILAGNDELAAGAWKALVKRRVRIPQEISLVGFGDRAEFSILEPPLTTVSVFPEKLGAALGRMMMDRLARAGGDVKSQVFPCRFMERNSCAPPVSRVTAVARR
jgi:LacI family transcriptional regulator